MANLTLQGDPRYSGRVNGISTIYTMEIKPKSVAYRYDVEISAPTKSARPDKIYTKQSDAAMITMQRQACFDIIEAMFETTESFGVKNSKYVYDGKRTLFTNKEITAFKNYKLINGRLRPTTAIFVKSPEITINIKPNETAPVIDYSDLQSSLVQDVTVQADHSVRTFLELLTSQYMINSGIYQSVSSGTLFEKTRTDLAAGMEIRVGFKKGVRVAEQNDKPTAMLVVDMKRTAFFAAKNVGDIYKKFIEESRNPNEALRNFEKHMKDVRVVVKYDKSRTFVFGRISDNPMRDRCYSVNRVSLIEFMKNEHEIRINYPDWRGVHPSGPNGRKSVYPFEVLEILEGQLVPIEKLNIQASRKLLMENSVYPNIRYDYVHRQVRVMAEGEAANFLRHFGVKIAFNSNSIVINQRGIPRIVYHDSKIVPKQNGSWFNDATTSKFVHPSKRLKKWIVVYEQKIRQNQVSFFINSLLGKCRELGMDVPSPMKYIPIPEYGLRNVFIENKGSVQFIFYIDDYNNKLHGQLKLYEAYYKILTQHVIVKNLAGGHQTLANIAMKFNVKTFGVNYYPELLPELKNYDLLNSKDILIIGLDVAHPGKLSPKERFDFKKKHADMENRHPSVVGICANKGAHAFAFAGDFFYQESRREALHGPSLTNAVKQAVKQAIANGRKPKRLIVVRDGLSEGQLSMAALEELPAIRAGWKEAVHELVANIVELQITFVICTKRHQKRFYRNNFNKISNTIPGDVVASKVTRTDVPEFFLQSHNAIKGVPKMPQYTIVANELNMEVAEMQGLMVYLSNMHQVSGCPTSLPLPVYLAHETAKRGQDIYNELFRMRNFTSRNQENEEPFASDIRMDTDGIFNIHDLTTMLGYADHLLSGTRFNA